LHNSPWRCSSCSVDSLKPVPAVQFRRLSPPPPCPGLGLVLFREKFNTHTIPSFYKSHSLQSPPLPLSNFSKLQQALYHYDMSRHMLPLLLPSILTGKHGHTSSGRSEPKQASQPASSSLPRPLSRTSLTPQPALRPEGLTSEQPSAEKKLVRTRVPAVTSKARTTAPEKDNSRRNRRKYPSSMRQRPH